jgi:hypothetical protein
MLPKISNKVVSPEYPSKSIKPHLTRLKFLSKDMQLRRAA